jgi:Domain of unknown function (DUF4349)
MTRTTVRRVAVAAALVLTLGLAACSGGDDPGGGDSGNALVADTTGGGDESGGGGDGEAAAGPEEGGTAVDLDVVAQGRRVISTATVRLRVDDLGAAVSDASELAADLGGLVFAEETDLRNEARTQLTLKVPPGQFRALLAALADLGEVETQTVSTDDVTEQVVDLDSRIRTSEASVERLRALLDQATTVRDITTIEGELLRRETDLETLRGELRTIERQVAMATVTVTFQSQRSEPPPPEEEAQPGFFDGLRGGGHALKVAAIAGSAVAGALLPWLPLLLVAALVTRRWWRRPAPSS